MRWRLVLGELCSPEPQPPLLRTREVISRARSWPSAMHREDRASCPGYNLVHSACVQMRDHPCCRLRAEDDEIGTQRICTLENLVGRDALLDDVPRLAPEFRIRGDELVKLLKLGVCKLARNRDLGSLACVDDMEERQPRLFSCARETAYGEAVGMSVAKSVA